MSTTTSTASLTLDFAFEEPTLYEGLDAFLRQHDLRDLIGVEVLQESGPGGGWPVVKFTGEPADLLALADAYPLDKDDPSRLALVSQS